MFRLGSGCTRYECTVTYLNDKSPLRWKLSEQGEERVRQASKPLSPLHVNAPHSSTANGTYCYVPMPFPSPLEFLSSLLCSPTASTPSDGSLLSSETKPILLTLHCLFPSDLLPALDLLDRRLVTRFVLETLASPVRNSSDPRGSEEAPTRQEKHEGRAAVYYVRSSQRSRYSRATAEAIVTNYEVRLQAWNCTCPAFAFAAFGPQDEDTQVDLGNDDENNDDDDGREGVRVEDTFGGLALGKREVPVCKHLLACLLVEMGGSLGDFANQRVVGREEMAGWAAGWGG